MKMWQSFINEHCNIQVINEDTVKVFNSQFNPTTGETFDDFVTYDPDIRGLIVDTVKQGKDFEIVETNTYTSTREYLGY